MRICRAELRDLRNPLAMGTVVTLPIPDAEVWVDGPGMGETEDIKARVRHVDVPGAPSILGAYIRTSTHEWTLAIAEAERFVGFGEQRLFAAVRDQVLVRHMFFETEMLGKMPELRPGDYKPPPPPIRDYVPRSFRRAG